MGDAGQAWGFSKPHRIGSVCRYPCEQCGEDADAHLFGPDGALLPVDTPLFIRGASTRDEWLASGGADWHGFKPAKHFYVVTSD